MVTFLKDKILPMKLYSGMLTFMFLMLLTLEGYAQERQLQSSPKNKILEANTGGVVAETKELIKEEQVRIRTAFTVKKGYLKFKYEEGTLYPLRRAKDGYDLYYAHDRLQEGKYKGVGIQEDDPEDIIAVLVSPEGDLIKLKKYKLNDKIEMTDTFQKCNTCYTQELRYAGMQGNELLFTYRELVGVLNKVRFESEFTYSFDPDQTIDFKGLSFKVSKATNTSITYEILESFDSLN